MRGILATVLCFSCGRVDFQTRTIDAAIDARPLSVIAEVQAGENDSMTTSNVLALADPVQAHDAIIACFTFSSGAASFQSISDSLGNAYTIVAGPVLSNGYLHYVAIAASSPAGSDAVTVTLSASQGSGGWELLALEYTGLAQAAPFDTMASDSGNGSAMSSGTVTTSDAHELLLAYGHSTGLMAGSGYTSRDKTNVSMVEDQVVFTTGSYTATATTNPGIWTLILATFADR